jgi:predicted esterase
LPTSTNYRYYIYRAEEPILHGYQLQNADNLGSVKHNSSENVRMSAIIGSTKYLRIDSSSAYLDDTKGLFVATSVKSGSFYYAVTVADGSVEDTSIVVGSNTLSRPVTELVSMPQPVWQESWTSGPKTFLHYVQFVTGVTSDEYPLMTNVGTYPFNFALITTDGPAPHPVTFWLHPGGGNFLQTSEGLGIPNEWVVSIDDELPNGLDIYTMYYGYAKHFDIYSSSNPVPVADTLFDYTSARVIHTIRWCKQYLPIDSTRTYMTGFSLGAIGALFTAMLIPSEIAAIVVYSPRVNFGLPFETNYWDEMICERLYGTPASNLPTNEGVLRNQRLDANYLADINRLNSLPVLYTFCGKYDYDVDWDEKVFFYSTLDADKHGGYHFWGPTDHGGTAYNSPWRTQFPNLSFFTRYRTDASYPAFSNCSINNNPGDGNRYDGDSVGTINGYLDWDDDIVDSINRWECTIRIKDLQTVYGTLVAPDSAVVDITPRRLQHFSSRAGSTIQWKNIINDNVVQEGEIFQTERLITLSSLKVFKSSTRIIITVPETTLQVPVQSRWSMVSCPLIVANDSVSNLFPLAVTKGYSYNPSSGYQEQERMLIGKGYWIRSSDSESVSFTGVGNYIDTINLDDGWNLIGSLTVPIDVKNIVIITDGLIISDVYGFSSSYFATDTIQPGKGYWIKANKNGRIVLRSYHN